jgi:hypothetical protein
MYENLLYRFVKLCNLLAQLYVTLQHIFTRLYVVGLGRLDWNFLEVRTTTSGGTSSWFAVRCELQLGWPSSAVCSQYVSLVLLLNDPVQGGSFISLRSMRRNTDTFTIIIYIITIHSNVLNFKI